MLLLFSSLILFCLSPVIPLYMWLHSLYVIGTDGTSQLTKPVQRWTNPTSDVVTWSYVPVDIGDVFETLDLSADINDKWGDLDKDEDTIGKLALDVEFFPITYILSLTVITLSLRLYI